MSRLNQPRQELLEPRRMDGCKKKLESLGFKVEQLGKTQLQFLHKGSKISFFPYSGWHTGKTIKDGRGFKKLLNQVVED